MLQVAGIVFRHRPARNRFTCTLDCFPVAADQIMPVGQRLALGTQTIGAGRRQPVDRSDIARGQPNAIGDKGAAMPVIGTLRGAPVEQATGDVGREQLARLLILQLVQASFAAAVAQRLPLAAIELVERRIFPEARAHRAQRSIVATIASGAPATGTCASG
jgi:hypothetical protein